MPRQIAYTVENNFIHGLITEASGLNFPENAVTDTDNCIFNFDGSVERRPGLDFEYNFLTKTIDRTGVVVNTYLWKNVSGNGDVSLFVAQVGTTIYFYETQNNTISASAVTSNVSLTTYLAAGAPSAGVQECQFAAGNGVLFVSHPYCDPIYIAYDTVTQTATATRITPQIRDLSGVDDGLTIDNRPTATLAGLAATHKYNLYNQGWNTTNLTAWDTAFTTMPSNCDVMWSFKNASDVFDTTTVPNVINGNSPAPKGHFILDLHNQDRSTVSGVATITTITTSYQRPSTIAFHAGRVFYSGVNYVGYNSRIFFSQIIERADQYGKCYQQNDPTAEDLFDLLPSDGGYIQILDAGTIYKLVSIVGGLVVFASNGVWFITGSQGVGFTATDYTVAKISSVNAISASSFVDVNGVPAWWNYEGIYTLAPSESGGATVVSLTQTTIKSFYDDIAPISKITAKGFYHRITGVVQWIYRSTETTPLEEVYSYDRILNYSTRIKAFYPWSIPSDEVAINGIVVLDIPVGQTVVSDIIDAAADTVIDADGDVVTSYVTQNITRIPAFLYFVSYPSAGSYKFTFANTSNVDFLDWGTFGANQVYDSYFISGWKLYGQDIKKFQTNYIRVFSDNSSDTAFYIQGLWDFAESGNSGRWTNKQYITNSDGNFGVLSKRVKIRGNGLSLQLKVSSLTGQPFNVLGWATQQSGNASP